MAIGIFVDKAYDGFGDVAHAVKIADFLQQQLAIQDPPQEVYLITSAKYKTVAESFIQHTNPKIQWLSSTDFSTNPPKAINCALACGYSLSLMTEKIQHYLHKHHIPIILCQEYGVRGTTHEISYNFELKGGFDLAREEKGVIPHYQALTPASDSELKKAFSQLPDTLQKHLAADSDAYLAQYRNSRQFSYLYCHGPNNESVAYFKQHLAFTQHTESSQDVLLIHVYDNYTTEDLEDLISDFKAYGYSKLTFINLDSSTETCVYDSLTAGKEYRIFYTKSVSMSAMKAIPQITTSLAGTTGDQSFVEALSCGLLVAYECYGHKRKFYAGYLAAVQAKATNETVKQLVELLTLTYDHSTKEERERLLGNQAAVEELKSINRTLVANSDYSSTLLENLYIHNIWKAAPEITPLWDALRFSQALLDEINSNKRHSPQWQCRLDAAKEIHQLFHAKCKESLTSKTCKFTAEEQKLLGEHLKCIQQNKPSWKERSLLQKIIDILSLGMVFLVRTTFFADKTSSRCSTLDNALKEHPFKPS